MYSAHANLLFCVLKRQWVSYMEGPTSQCVHSLCISLEKLSRHFSSSSFVIRVNRLHP